MRYAISAIVGCMLTASPVMAFTVMDGSEKSIEPKTMATLADALLVQFADPASAQLAKLSQPEAGTVCGIVNAKNKHGGYVGFAPFKFIAGRSKLYVGDAARC
ncbi:hypothetical protein [Rhizobium leucaenae]|uniref:hypothetical protein n=1 Tax=Rhizobium leucaenae TaxID=29450 RepID=UPI0007EE6409|nr:hypothetical protein [Rhizobium leucaenae]